MNRYMKQATTEDPFEFWVKVTKSGQRRAYFYSRNTGKTGVSLSICEDMEARGTAVRVPEPTL